MASNNPVGPPRGEDIMDISFGAESSSSDDLAVVSSKLSKAAKEALAAQGRPVPGQATPSQVPGPSQSQPIHDTVTVEERQKFSVELLNLLGATVTPTSAQLLFNSWPSFSPESQDYFITKAAR